MLTEEAVPQHLLGDDGGVYELRNMPMKARSCAFLFIPDKLDLGRFKVWHARRTETLTNRRECNCPRTMSCARAGVKLKMCACSDVQMGPRDYRQNVGNIIYCPFDLHM